MTDSAVIVIGESGADAERLDQLAGYLREELSAIDDVRVGNLTGPAPEGSRAVDLAAAGALVIAMGKAGALRGVITAVQRWLERSPQSGRSIRVEMGGDVLELSNASTTAEGEIVSLFVNRHNG